LTRDFLPPQAELELAQTRTPSPQTPDSAVACLFESLAADKLNPEFSGPDKQLPSQAVINRPNSDAETNGSCSDGGINDGPYSDVSTSGPCSDSDTNELASKVGTNELASDAVTNGSCSDAGTNGPYFDGGKNPADLKSHCKNGYVNAVLEYTSDLGEDLVGDLLSVSRPAGEQQKEIRQDGLFSNGRVIQNCPV
jgi:hypothetical protein